MSKELEFLVYNSENENITVNAVVKEETIWLNQKAMAELFDCSTDNISLHIKNIYSEGELDKNATAEEFSVVQNEGSRRVNRKSTFYNLDAIISVGYRVNSKKATNFRIWATSILKDYMLKGFVMNDERLKQGKEAFGKDYFKELLERVRSIRTSERRIWEQITDMFAECSIDYDVNSETTRKFFSLVQNKFHYAITGKTAAEIVYLSADSTKENMGLKNWKYAPDGRILSTDTTVAKNYLQEKEIKKLERNVSSYFDYIEDLIEDEKVFQMEDFSKSVDDFLSFRKYDLLIGHGSISRKQADKKAKEEYQEFNKNQKIASDFNKFTKELKERG